MISISRWQESTSGIRRETNCMFYCHVESKIVKEEEDADLFQHHPKLQELIVCLSKSFTVGVHFNQLVLMFSKLDLK